MSTNTFGLADDPVVQAKSKIEETANAVTRQARELADILATVSAAWTGVGASGFMSAQSMVNDDHDEIRRLLGVLHNAVAQTKNLSNAQDDDVRAAFRAVQLLPVPAAAPTVPASTASDSSRFSVCRSEKEKNMAGNDGHTRVRYETVQQMADRIRIVSKNIITDLNEMEQALKVVTDTWDGEAHGQYVQLQAKYKGKADHMQKQLEQVAQLIERGKGDYRATDVKASRLFTEAY